MRAYEKRGPKAARLSVIFRERYAASLPAIALTNQSLPSTRREMMRDEQVSPVALTIVAAGSTRKPIVAIIGKASGGKP